MGMKRWLGGALIALGFAPMVLLFAGGVVATLWGLITLDPNVVWFLGTIGVAMGCIALGFKLYQE